MHISCIVTEIRKYTEKCSVNIAAAAQLENMQMPFNFTFTDHAQYTINYHGENRPGQAGMLHYTS